MDRIGKAIQLWSAENGKSIGESGHGYNGQGFGAFHGYSGPYPPPSLEGILRESGYLTGDLSVNSGYMLTPCTTYSDTRRVVLSIANPAPPTTIVEQDTASGCTSGWIDLYTGQTNQGYNRNFLKAY